MLDAVILFRISAKQPSWGPVHPIVRVIGAEVLVLLLGLIALFFIEFVFELSDRFVSTRRRLARAKTFKEVGFSN